MNTAENRNVRILTHSPSGETYSFIISLRSSLTQSTAIINIVHRAPVLTRIQNKRLMQRRLLFISSPGYSVSETLVQYIATLRSKKALSDQITMVMLWWARA